MNQYLTKKFFILLQNDYKSVLSKISKTLKAIITSESITKYTNNYCKVLKNIIIKLMKEIQGYLKRVIKMLFFNQIAMV